MLLVNLESLILILQVFELLLQSMVVTLSHSQFIDLILQLVDESILMMSETLDNSDFAMNRPERYSFWDTVTGINLSESNLLVVVVVIDWRSAAGSTLV